MPAFSLKRVGTLLHNYLCKAQGPRSSVCTSSSVSASLHRPCYLTAAQAKFEPHQFGPLGFCNHKIIFQTRLHLRSFISKHHDKLPIPHPPPRNTSNESKWAEDRKLLIFSCLTRHGSPISALAGFRECHACGVGWNLATDSETDPSPQEEAPEALERPLALAA